MVKRIEAVMRALPGLRVKPAHALREAIAEGYGARNLRTDMLSGIVVGVVALPLSMALAIASGVPPQHGLYTAIIAGFLIALMGGSRVQVSGPTAAFVVILAPITEKYGLGGLACASMLAGVLLALMGLLRFGTLIEFIPYPVTTGFTAGIAVVIATLQIKDFLGLTIVKMPEHYVNKVAALAKALPSIHWPNVGIGVGTLLLLLIWPRFVRKVPGPLVALSLAAVAAIGLAHYNPEWTVATINSRFSYVVDGVTHPGIPQLPPLFVFPWTEPGGNGEPLALDFGTFRALLVASFAIAMLGAIESLLSAVVSDGMINKRHDPNAELLAQGLGNLTAPFFGGFAATGAIARTATNVRCGGRSPIAAITHAIFVLGAMVLFAPYLGYLPMASLAALLLVVAKNMSELKHFVYVLRIGPRSDVAVLITCFLLTVIFDMTIAVSAGIVLAAMLFMRRMADVSEVQLIGSQHPDLSEPLPPGIMLYEINGPLFFGAAQKAMSSLHAIGAEGGHGGQRVKVVILDLESVPVIDATGLVNLQSTILRLHRDHVFCVLASVQPQPMQVLEKAGLEELDSRIGICTSLEEAVTMAKFQLAMWEDLRHHHTPTSH